MDQDLRNAFVEAVKRGDNKTQMSILGMALAGITSELGISVHIAGESTTEN